MIPAPVIQLHEPDAVFDQTAGQKTIVRKRRVISLVQRSWIVRAFRRRYKTGLCPVEIQYVLGFPRDIHHFRNRNLHPARQFILSDTSHRLRITTPQIFRPIHFGERIEHAAAQFPVHSRRVTKIQNGITGRTTLHSLIDAG